MPFTVTANDRTDTIDLVAFTFDAAHDLATDCLIDGFSSIEVHQVFNGRLIRIWQASELREGFDGTKHANLMCVSSVSEGTHYTNE